MLWVMFHSFLIRVNLDFFQGFGRVPYNLIILNSLRGIIKQKNKRLEFIFKVCFRMFTLLPDLLWFGNFLLTVSLDTRKTTKPS